VPGVIFDKWAWIIILSVCLVIIGPLVIIWGVLNLPADLRIIATVCIIILWGVISGYKDWVISKRGEKEKPSQVVQTKFLFVLPCRKGAKQKRY